MISLSRFFGCLSNNDFGGFPMEFATKLLQEKKVAAVPGSAFSDDPDSANYIRCSYATGIEQIKAALDLIEEFVNELKTDA